MLPWGSRVCLCVYEADLCDVKHPVGSNTVRGKQTWSGRVRGDFAIVLPSARSLLSYLLCVGVAQVGSFACLSFLSTYARWGCTPCAKAGAAAHVLITPMPLALANVLLGMFIHRYFNIKMLKTELIIFLSRTFFSS